MALALEHFFCCLDLKLGGIIMAWWGMVISAISIVSCVLALIAGDRGGYINYLPLHVVTSNGLISAILTILILVIYFYFSYQLLLGAQGVSWMWLIIVINEILIWAINLCRAMLDKWLDISSFTVLWSCCSFSQLSIVSTVSLVQFSICIFGFVCIHSMWNLEVAPSSENFEHTKNVHYIFFL